MASSTYCNTRQIRHQHNEQHQFLQQHQQSASSSHCLPKANAAASPVMSRNTSIVDENAIVNDYRPPGIISSPYHPLNDNENNKKCEAASTSNKKVQWVYNPIDGSVLHDHNGNPLSVDRLLATKPLRHELSTRPGPGNKKLTYISGDDVSRTLNDIFGFDGWDLDIKDVSKVDSERDPKTGKHTIVYTAQVRLTHRASGAYKEDCGAGDSTDRSYATATAHALKASITDAMKRAARHFGDKLGNSLYSGNFSINKAPVSLKDALDKYDIHRCNTKFGFQRSNKKPSSSVANTKAVDASHIPMPPPPAQQNVQQQQQQQNMHQRYPPASIVSNEKSGVGKQEESSLAHQHQHHNERNSHRPQNCHHTHPNAPSIAGPSDGPPPQQQQRTSISTLSFGAPANSNSETNIPAQQYQLQTHRQQHPPQKTFRANTNAPNVSGISNGPRPPQQSRNPNFPSSNGPAQPESRFTPESTNSATALDRPSSSYGRRPALGSISSSTTSAATTGQSFDTNNNHNDKNRSNDVRRVSLGNQHPQHMRQSMPAQNHHSNASITNNVPAISQTPSACSGGGNHNHYNKPQHKRPPLGNIVPNPEFAPKRPKPQHHNPYQQPYNSGRKSI